MSNLLQLGVHLVSPERRDALMLRMLLRLTARAAPTDRVRAQALPGGGSHRFGPFAIGDIVRVHVSHAAGWVQVGSASVQAAEGEGMPLGNLGEVEHEDFILDDPDRLYVSIFIPPNDYDPTPYVLAWAVGNLLHDGV